jgi:iron complex outermembrane receptor protein
VESYAIADLNVGLDIIPDLRFNVSVQNILNNKHIEFIGAPAIGRLATARLTQRF